MKEKDAEMSTLMSKLTLKNNLDKEDSEEAVESVVVVEKRDTDTDKENKEEAEEGDEYPRIHLSGGYFFKYVMEVG